MDRDLTRLDFAQLSAIVADQPAAEAEAALHDLVVRARLTR